LPFIVVPGVCPQSGNVISRVRGGAAGREKGQGGEEMWRDDGGAA
jgi:hypothetical protein